MKRAFFSSRRSFLCTAAAAAAAPYIVPASAVGADGAVPPSDRIALGVIGCGGKGTGGMHNFRRRNDVQVVVVCDPNRQNRDRTLKAVGLGPENGYTDFRELLARRDVDAVLVATPDHWHVLVSQAAAKAGKDVYCEKPLSNTIAEGRALADTIKRYGTVFQHGTQLKSLTAVRHACELVRNGRLGDLQEIRIGSPPGQATGYPPPQPVPDWIDYDMWLGPAPVAPFTPVRVAAPGWYFISDYSKAGWIAGFGVHDMDIAQWGIGMELSGPVEVSGTGVFPASGIFDTVLTFELKFRYANGVTITMTDTGRNRHGVTFIGTKGKVFTRSEIECDPPSLMRETFGPGDVRLYRSDFHEGNFIDCVKTRRPTITPIEIAHRSTSACLLGGIALQTGRTIRWDPQTERIIGDPEAERLLSYPMRTPWRL
jgi:predicted dehydrogenase